MGAYHGNAWTDRLILVAAIVGTLLTIWFLPEYMGIAFVMLFIEIAVAIGAKLDRKK